MNFTRLTNVRSGTALFFGRYAPLVLAGIIWLNVALFSPDFSALNAWLGGIALLAALVHLILLVTDNDGAVSNPGGTELNLANVSSSISIAASLTIVIVFILQ